MVAKKGFGQLFCHFSSFLEKNGPKEKDREVREEGERKRRRCHHGGTNKRTTRKYRDTEPMDTGRLR